MTCIVPVVGVECLNPDHSRDGSKIGIVMYPGSTV